MLLFNQSAKEIPVSQSTRVVMSILLLFGITSLSACSIFSPAKEPVMIEDPAEVAREAETFADYDLPPGYEEKLVAHLAVSKALFIRSLKPRGGTSLHQVIILMQIDNDLSLSKSEARRKIQQGLEQQMRDNNLNWKVADKTHIRINGQNVLLTSYESKDEMYRPVRQMVSGVFNTDSGPAALLLIGSVPGWDEEAIDAFIQSIR
jgi:hypothetical protein